MALQGGVSQIRSIGVRIGVGFPTVEIGADLAAVRDFVQTAEGLGYIHLLILDTVQGSKIRNRHIPRNTLAYSDLR